MSLLATSVWAGTFRDDFEDGNLNGWQKWEWPGQNTGKIEEKDGILKITDIDSRFDTVAVFNNRKHVADFTLTVDAKMTKANEGGKSNMEIWVRTAEETNGDWRGVWNIYYANDKAFLRLYTLLGMNERNVENIELPFSAKLGEWYRIKLGVKRSQLTLWIDEELVQEVDWRKHSAVLPEAGEIMIGVAGGETHWDNFIITGDDIRPVHPQSKLTTTWRRLKNSNDLRGGIQL